MTKRHEDHPGRPRVLSQTLGLKNTKNFGEKALLAVWAPSMTKFEKVQFWVFDQKSEKSPPGKLLNSPSDYRTEKKEVSPCSIWRELQTENMNFRHDKMERSDWQRLWRACGSSIKEQPFARISYGEINKPGSSRYCSPAKKFFLPSGGFSGVAYLRFFVCIAFDLHSTCKYRSFPGGLWCMLMYPNPQLLYFFHGIFSLRSKLRKSGLDLWSLSPKLREIPP